MKVKFFGHYLLDENIISKEQLNAAITYQATKNLSLGELAVRENLITKKEADLINDKQRILDKRFGEVAQELNLLEDADIVRLLEIQKAEKVFFGEVLVLKNFMTEDEVAQALEKFEASQKLEVVKLSDKIEALDKEDLIKNAIAILQKLFLRIVHEPIKLVDVNTTTQSSGAIIALQKMRGDLHLDFCLQPDDALSLDIASKFLKMPFDTVDEMVIDIISEFVNVVLGNIAVKFSEANTKLELTPPESLERDAFNAEEYIAFEFVSTKGNLAMFVKI